MPKLLHLKCGLSFLVDDDDYEWLSAFNWHASGRTRRYAERNSHIEWVDGKRKRVKQYMHREILGLKTGDGKFADHINGNPFDNRKCNLRITDAKGNSQNARPRKNKTTSKYKGVSSDPNVHTKRWRACMNIGGKIVVLGIYSTEEDAARAWDFAARQRFGEFAKLNFPEECPEAPPKALTRHCRGPQRGNKFKGVFFTDNRWRASLTANGCTYRLGAYATAQEAARAYDEAVKRILGYGYLNFPDEP